MSNWQGQQPQQWTTAPQGGFGQPQQSQGWGQGVGQWQQATPQGQGFFNPHQQFPVHQGQAQLQHQAFPQNQGGAGFMAGQVGGHMGGFQRAGGGGIPPGGMEGIGQRLFTGFPQQQQQQFQAIQQQQQQQQMAYIQEQQRLAKEAQKKRDVEIQKRKLMNINVANPTTSTSLSFDDLVSIKPSSSPKSSPKVTRQVQDGATPKTTPTTDTTQLQEHKSASMINDPVPIQPVSLPGTASSTVSSTLSSSDQSSSSLPSANNTFDKLMESSLSNLRDTSPRRSRKADFKSSTSVSKPSPLLSAQQKSFSESARARAWTAGAVDFSGVFAQHAPQPHQQLLHQQQLASEAGDNSFGEFQSVGAGGGAPSTALSEPFPGRPQASNQIVNLQGLQQQAPQLQLPTQHGFQGNPQLSGGAAALQQTTLFGGGNTVPTSAYQHPISSTSSEPQKPLSPTHFSNLDPNKFPPLYTNVFKRCSKPGEKYLLTELLFPLLTSSQLPKNVLRDLWSLANREVPGKLNQTELYVLLGLIGLAQSGNPSPTPEDLKKASKLPVPKLSALEEEAVPSADVPAQNVSPAPSQGAAPPTLPPPSAVQPPGDDFGDFQQGHLSSFQPSFPAHLVPPPGHTTVMAANSTTSSSNASSIVSAEPAVPVGGDKYSVFDELKSTGSGLISQNLPPTDTAGLMHTSGNSSGTQVQGKIASGDKYSMFDDLHSIGSGGTNSVTSSDLIMSSLTTVITAPLTAGVKQAQSGNVSLTTTTPPAAATSLVQNVGFGAYSSSPLSSSSSLSSMATSLQSQAGLLPFSSAPVPPSSANSGTNDSSTGFADFASFQSAPSGKSEQVGFSQTTHGADNSTQDWAAFTDFKSSQDTSLQQNLGFPSTSLPTASQSSGISTTTFGAAAVESKVGSAFDSLLPAELLSSKTLKSAAPVESSLSLLDPLNSKQPATSTTTAPSSVVAVELEAFDQLSLDSKEKKKDDAKKPLTGLEILEEEFSARVSAKAASSTSSVPSGSIPEPLVPESAPMDDFGDFEAYSSPGKEGKKTSLLPVTDSPPVLKKSSTDPVRVWSTCLTKCSEVMESCANVFSDVKEESILEEITQSEEGRNKLKGIVEVYRLSKRVYRSLREKKEGAEGDNCVHAIQKHWKKMVNVLPNDVMSQLYLETTPASVTEEDVLSDSISRCSLCLTSKNVSIPPHLSLDGKVEDYTMPLLFHNGQSYHPSCANFWINVVQEELPVLT